MFVLSVAYYPIMRGGIMLNVVAPYAAFGSSKIVTFHTCSIFAGKNCSLLFALG
jgi:hypothetical protein